MKIVNKKVRRELGIPLVFSAEAYETFQLAVEVFLIDFLEDAQQNSYHFNRTVVFVCDILMIRGLKHFKF